MSLRLLLQKDLRTELRGKEALQAGLILVGLLLMAALFAYDSLAARPAVAAATLWVPVVFATVLAMGRSFAAEADAGLLDWLRSQPVPTALHGASRTLVNAALALLLTGTSALLVAALFAVPVVPALPLLALAAIGMAIVGTLVGALAAQARARDVLLPILVLPAVLPLLQVGVEGTVVALEGGSTRLHLLLALGYDLLAAGMAWLLWPFVLEAD